MNGIEALYEAYKNGKKVRPKKWGFTSIICNLKYKWVDFQNNNNFIFSYQDLLDEWEIYEAPPKEVDFAEAFKALSKHKTIKSIVTNNTFQVEKCDDYDSTKFSILRYIRDREIDGKWIIYDSHTD